ncbi:MAG: amidohydrolase family protein, partial [Acidimicrobiia bacterium]|nr:amidohydrolase family protein [Acidimicrobiia bacterium]
DIHTQDPDRPTAQVLAPEDGRKGTLAPGMLADLVVLGEDLLAIDRDGIGQVPVLATVVGGTVAHDLMGLAAGG